jgi:MFS family permease
LGQVPLYHGLEQPTSSQSNPLNNTLISTSSQVIYSRFSDIFGRKILLVIAIAIFTLGNLLCGFSKSLAQLIVFRVIAGMGGGGVNVLVLIIMSDITSLEKRGKVVFGVR